MFKQILIGCQNKSYPTNWHKIMTDLELLSKLKWDSHYNNANFTFGIFDRVTKGIIETEGTVKLDETKYFMNITVQSVETSIPVHRLRYVKRNGEVTWSRAGPTV